MTDEQREINRRVAVALGWNGLKDYGTAHGGWFGWSPSNVGWGSNREPVPDYCRDPAAADLVRQEIERRGLLWSIAPGISDKRYFSYVTGGTVRCAKEPYGLAEGDSWMEAICLAFLAACESTAEEGGEG